MRLHSALLMFALLAAASGVDAQENASTVVKGVPGRDRISVVLMLKPGETKQVMLSTWCTVGITRGSGLEVGELKEGHFVTHIDKSNRGQIWKQDGLKVVVPSADEATKTAESPEFAAFKKQGLDVFFVQVSAAGDAKPGLVELHIQDSTCSGTCRTDLRVLVLTP
jgi:hypothetical protein